MTKNQPRSAAFDMSPFGGGFEQPFTRAEVGALTSVTGSAIRAALDWTVAGARSGRTFISGFHSPLERSVLEELRTARSKMVIALARDAAKARLPDARRPKRSSSKFNPADSSAAKPIKGPFAQRPGVRRSARDRSCVPVICRDQPWRGTFRPARLRSAQGPSSCRRRPRAIASGGPCRHIPPA